MNPMDIIRTRAQLSGASALGVARELLSSEGLAGFWKGSTVRMVMLLPQGAISASAYEFVKRMSVKEARRAELGMA